MMTQQSTMDNPFGFGFEGTTEEPTELTDCAATPISIEDDIYEYLTNIDARKAARRASSMVIAGAEYVVAAAKKIAEVFASIVKQAIKMATFKMAIEMCAMAIKTMVESMINMKLTPPNIDTKGVFYNIQGANTAPVAAPVSNSRYDSNPFSNPFGSMPGSTW